MLLRAIVLPSLLFVGVYASKCQPVTWADDLYRRQDAAEPTSGLLGRDSDRVQSESIISTGPVAVGEINCRDSTATGKDVNYYTCTQIASRFGITTDRFFQLNPTLRPDCSNIAPNTEYCIDGFIEPLRSTDGFCGPHHNNATCLGTAAQCCNAQTWKCGDTPDDCAMGTCYEGACAGDKVYSTDGTCGIEHGMRLCAGVQGDCCSVNGTCGTGEAFCGLGNCQLGNCVRSATPPQPTPSWMAGNTTDGTCGGKNKYSCNAVYGWCCNKDGLCGSLPTDCGQGCQPEWGSCSASSPLSTTHSVPTTSSSTSRTSSVPTTKSTTKPTTQPTTHPTTKPTTHPMTKPTTPSSTAPAFSALPPCGKTCINNMLGQYKALGCAHPDPACLCQNANFGYGIRDCANGACGASVAPTVIAYGSALCRDATTLPPKTTSRPTTAPTPPAPLPSCGQLCFNNMLAQHAQLGCAKPDAACLCKNANFGYGLRDCAHGACTKTADAAAAIAYGSAYCASARATATAKA